MFRECFGVNSWTCLVRPRGPYGRSTSLYFRCMEILGDRARPLPAPPRIVFQSLAEPKGPGTSPWVVLLEDETPPIVLQAEEAITSGGVRCGPPDRTMSSTSRSAPRTVAASSASSSPHRTTAPTQAGWDTCESGSTTCCSRTGASPTASDAHACGKPLASSFSCRRDNSMKTITAHSRTITEVYSFSRKPAAVLTGSIRRCSIHNRPAQ